MDEFEEGLSEFRVFREVRINHTKCTFTQTEQYFIEEASEYLTLLLHDTGEKHECFGVPSIQVRILVILNHCLEDRQEIIIEVGEVSFIFDIDLYELKDVSPYCFHWSQQVINARRSISYGVADALGIKLIDID